jgi:hypothetical protein
MYEINDKVKKSVEDNDTSVNWLDLIKNDPEFHAEGGVQPDQPAPLKHESSAKFDTTEQTSAPAKGAQGNASIKQISVLADHPVSMKDASQVNIDAGVKAAAPDNTPRRDINAAIQDIWVRDNFYQTNRWTRFSTIDKNLTEALQEHRGILAHNDRDAPNGLHSGDYLVLEYQANKDNPRQGTITLGSREARPYVTSRAPAGVEDLGDGRLRMNLDTFNGLFDGLRYQSRAALSDMPNLTREVQGNNIAQLTNDVRYGGNFYQTNSWTRYSTVDRNLAEAMKDERGAIAERWISRYYPFEYTSDCHRYLVVGYRPNQNDPQAGMITLARDPSTDHIPGNFGREEHLRYLGVEQLGNDRFRMSLHTFNTIFHGLRYQNK